MYGTFINNEKEVILLFEMVFNALQDGINVQTYRKRAVIIKNITDEKQIVKKNEIYLINAITTIEHLVQKLFKDYPSRITIRNCTNCSSKRLLSNF